MTHTVDIETVKFFEARRLACVAVETAWLNNAPADELKALRAHRDHLYSQRREDVVKKFTPASYSAALVANPTKTSDEVRAMFWPIPDQTYAERQAELDKPVRRVVMTSGGPRTRRVNVKPQDLSSPEDISATVPPEDRKLTPALRRRLRKAGFKAPYGADAFTWLENN